MGRAVSPLGSIEDRLVRVSAAVRSSYNLALGTFLEIKGKDGKPILLRASNAYSEDVQQDPECIYVNENTYKLLDVEQTHTVKPSDDILIGCDPEFFLVDKMTGFSISASHFFHHYGEVGSDQGLAELRPRPSYNEAGVTNELLNLMRKAYEHLNTRGIFKKADIHMLAASHHNNKSAGYHVHYGLPQFMLKADTRSHIILARMVHVLDYYVGIPAILPEGDEDYYRRSELYSRYGKPGDHRVDMATLEYRVPGGHLLRHPILSSGILAICTTVMKDMLSRFMAYTNGFRKQLDLSDYEKLKKFYPRLPDRDAVYQSIVNRSPVKAMSFVDEILSDLSKMIGFSPNSQQILAFFDYVLNYSLKRAKFTDDMETNWRLVNEKQPGKMEVLRSSN